MRIALGSDERGELPATLERALENAGHTVMLFGALAPGDDDAWPSVGQSVGEAVASGRCATGIVCCWTGTGVSIAANKVRGVRAALCGDAATASGARTWNDANVLALSMRATTPTVGEEILNAWLSGAPTADDRYRGMIETLRDK
ncbi:MAG: RpiB/LacA/LacB family sugar-phosphate isomerase [Candidatus Eremiobacteraeota bacterium]|nr:RpiB/LacA/LacB family sugar-phosphate isomerase [Candidatus Eremiobacteraeota bacterium]